MFYIYFIIYSNIMNQKFHEFWIDELEVFAIQK